MRTKNVTDQALKEFITDKNIVLMAELKNFLKTKASMTVFRRLQKLSYISSCSDRGRYYSLNEIAKFNETGLWIYNSIIFSLYGNLMKTCEHFVNNSQAGYSNIELKQIIGIDVKESLLNLFKRKKLVRDQLGNQLIYFSIEPPTKRSQIILRKNQINSAILNVEKLYTNLITDELKAAIILFYSILDERQRRLYAGLESLKFGYGGDNVIAQLLKVDPHTVSKGRKELVKEDFDRSKGIREKGGGRKAIKKNA